ncbi:MAG: GNAT family N-acetyltransferase, partial [Flavobacteriaceae bacterium]|nr:GNAT family N-acetyltransferase [Flavobacteriaceae bacterium]
IEKFQGKGFGKILVEKSEEILTNKNINYVWCNARVLALNFYKNIGFTIMGEPFDIPPIGKHFSMSKKLI